jgi:Peptide-N-glycosidase F, C terminal
MRSIARFAVASLPLLVFAPLLTVCGGTSESPVGDATSPDAGALPDAEPTPDGGAPPDADTPPSGDCEQLGLAARPFSEGPYGLHRGDLAEDFSVALLDGSEFHLRERWSGCDSYLFVPDTLRVSSADSTSLWERDVDALVRASPPNAHYFFVSRAASEGIATAATSAMQAEIERVLGTLDVEAASRWRERLHVVQPSAGGLDTWLGRVLRGHGRGGFLIDPSQRLRDVGSLADVIRFDPALQEAGGWPWANNLAYVANEARYVNGEARRQARLDAEDATVVPIFSGEVLSEFAETGVSLPSAAEMARFDTLEIEVTMSCPDAEAVEFGNCGAWDYLASLALQGDAGNIEIARFITSYHRETHWVVDVTPMLVHLRGGGQRRFRWDFAPSWNPQPTATRLSLRLSNRGKGYSPAEAIFLHEGGSFNSMYNASRMPVEVEIPEGAKRVELFALISGHGGATNNCAEFCNHQHEFSVNDVKHRAEFREAATNDGCMAEIENGMIPNQGGTWWFGRGGWCPGQQVEPWVVDVTPDVAPGSTATVSYQGLYRGATPPDDSGDIRLSSYLVVYR